MPATRQLSLYSNFSVGENLSSRLGRPEIAGPGLRALSKQRMRALAEESVGRFLVKARSTRAGHPLALGRQPAEGRDRPGAGAVEPRLLLLEEPTRGVDIAGKREIYRLLRGFAARATR